MGEINGYFGFGAVALIISFCLEMLIFFSLAPADAKVTKEIIEFDGSPVEPVVEMLSSAE